MTRAEYKAKRHAARLASRSYWLTLKDKFTTTYDRDRAYARMMDARLAVPGGVWTPYVYPVLLDGWQARRQRVQSALYERRTKARIAVCMETMAQRFSA